MGSVATEVKEAELSLVRTEPEEAAWINNLAVVVSRMPVTCQREFEGISDVTRQIATTKKRIEEKFKPRREAAHRLWKDIVAWQKEYTDKLDAAREVCNQKIAAYWLEQKKLEKQAAAVADLPMVAPFVEKAEGVGVRLAPRAKIVNEAEVPDQFWKIDEVALNAFVRATKGQRPIPGVEIIWEPVVSAKSIPA